ncbi:tRNA-dihydrouridine(20/20a) synthase isoform X1 [Capsicum annuum]
MRRTSMSSKIMEWICFTLREASKDQKKVVRRWKTSERDEIVFSARKQNEHGRYMSILSVNMGGRLSSNIFYGSSSKPRTLCAYNQNSKLHSTSLMGAEHYPPPWFSVAPMMEWTNNHYRTLARLISKKAWLYTEMLAAETIVYQTGNLDRFLAYGPEQHPIVLQIGGNNLENLAKATQLATPYGYDEINFNCGCPSPRVVGHGCFGVCLMLDPKFVAEAMCVIAANTNVPVSVKCRIGLDGHDSYNELCDFIYKVSSQSPTRHFIIHSRKALLNGISPADNRKIPPLKYEYYYALLRDFPDLQFTINGGINSIDEVNAARMEGAHGVMLGRAAYSNPWRILGLVDSSVYGAPLHSITRRQVLEQYQVYGDSVVRMYGNKPNIRDVVKPLLGLFHGEPRNVVWKRKVDAALLHCTTIKSLLEETLGEIPERVLDAPITEVPSGSTDMFIKVKSLLPPPYTVNEEDLLYA